MNNKKVSKIIRGATIFDIITPRDMSYKFLWSGIAQAYALSKAKVPVWVYMQVDKASVPSLTSREVEEVEMVSKAYHQLCKEDLKIDYKPVILYATDAQLCDTIRLKLNDVANISIAQDYKALDSFVHNIEEEYVASLERAWMKSFK
jgi:hypothetical protein|tara:strand:+ start:3293 stop:3733 length:441 start_codon:yes stop_codon:yes gene_type:complete